MDCSLLILQRPGMLWATHLLPVTSTALTHVQRRFLTPQWIFRGRSTAEVLSILELPYSTGKTYYGKAADSRGMNPVAQMLLHYASTTGVGPEHNPSSTSLFSPKKGHMRTLKLSPDLTFTANPFLCDKLCLCQQLVWRSRKQIHRGGCFVPRTCHTGYSLGSEQADSLVAWKESGIKMVLSDPGDEAIVLPEHMPWGHTMGWVRDAALPGPLATHCLGDVS
ncbi:uncharacterized protein LOC108640551 [Manacus vitellinus]|uniref:uncharacterized protein LOC108640551 n=1 Tax=Manacus vitellinus TaxID=328815 RepID=UPI0008463917|nr:uncharacterized protein LOC108640551 [Manacus vitellinus]